jgi:hypothetical protein
MKAYLHFGAGDEPRQTLEVECRITELPWQAAGRTWTATGYGARIPSRYMVKHEGRWRRVYVACYSNNGSAYLGKPGAWLCTVDLP